MFVSDLFVFLFATYFYDSHTWWASEDWTIWTSFGSRCMLGAIMYMHLRYAIKLPVSVSLLSIVSDRQGYSFILFWSLEETLLLHRHIWIKMMRCLTFSIIFSVVGWRRLAYVFGESSSMFGFNIMLFSLVFDSGFILVDCERIYDIRDSSLNVFILIGVLQFSVDTFRQKEEWM